MAKKNKHKKHKQTQDIFQLLENPPEFKVDRNYEKEKDRVEERLTRTERRDWAWKQEILQIQANQFIVDTELQLLHDRSCPEGRKLPRERFSMREDFDPSLSMCETCRKKAVIRQLTQWPEDYKEVLNLLDCRRIDIDDLVRLVRSNVTVRYITYNTLELQKGEDRWRLKKLDEGRFELYHNSYLLEDCRRRFTGKFHQEDLRGKDDFHHVSSIVVHYDPNFHIAKALEVDKKNMDQAIEQAPNNLLFYPLTAAETFKKPTIRRAKRKGILFDYFIYVDCDADYAQNVFRKRRIWSIRLHELAGISGEYKLVFCKIFKFHRCRLFPAMNEVKNHMYKKHCYEGYIIMQAAGRYFAEKGVETETLRKKLL